jgi:CHASE3 domain sensor protein
MNEETEFGYKARQILNQAIEDLDSDVANRIHEARQVALKSQRAPVVGLRLAGIGSVMERPFFAQARNLVAVMALTLGATGTYYWNAFEQAQEYEEIDSALLVDELPPSAYLDRGFHAWLEHVSDSSSQ